MQDAYERRWLTLLVRINSSSNKHVQTQYVYNSTCGRKCKKASQWVSPFSLIVDNFLISGVFPTAHQDGCVYLLCVVGVEGREDTAFIRLTVNRQAGKQASRQAGKQASRQAGEQASRQAGKQASRQAGQQTIGEEAKDREKAQHRNVMSAPVHGVCCGWEKLVVLSRAGSALKMNVLSGLEKKTK